VRGQHAHGLGRRRGGFPLRLAVQRHGANDELIGYWDRGSTLTLQDGDSCLIDFDGTNGVLQNG
jgi:hypothetical protein